MQRLAHWSENGWTLPLIAGLMLGASFYVPWIVFNLLALVPLLVWLERHEERSRWFRLRGAVLAGLACHLISTSFVLALSRFSWLAYLLYPAFAMVLALKVGLIATVASWLRRRTGLPWVWILPVVWVSADWLLTFGDLRMPGDHLYHTMTAYPFLIQFADVTGPYGITAAVVAVNVLLHHIMIDWPRPRARASTLLLVLLGATLLVYDTIAWRKERPVESSLRVGVIQPDVRMLVKWNDDANDEQWEKLARLSREAVGRGAELLVWPETAVPWPMFHWLERPETRALQPVQDLARELGVPILAGLEYVRVRTVDDWDLFNAAMVVTADGALAEPWTAKAYLVPFTEKLPFAELFGGLLDDREGEWRFVTGGFEEAEPGQPLPIAGTEVGALVCYEQLFADLFRAQQAAGAGWLAVITNDAWFARTPFQRYQADAVRLRAIETRRDIVRAANTGISGFVDARGNLFDATRLYEEAVIVRDVSVREGRTIYGRTGDVLAWAAVAGCVLTLALAFARRRDRG
ncbi:MAG: apolipoprotein N-acyltransferase [Acidobacteria bacterium]|nr:apolipoprotein N-acyltransferase [Acidobacteriota bacterium]NIM62772.1 apolipoprotein N-acyltransferase [Acidobacteriota bacterium]NIO59072.1 apolipoprotein N-acyltransferase [Acidobacteriota bacterium]NIQ30111.1 apolipoprotein N-acyltransferase [Acidobacteriota bacterium]NIQ84914.1 apolipoprotein N-acyltransferase [Acidobacteriota bacterium]